MSPSNQFVERLRTLFGEEIARRLLGEFDGHYLHLDNPWRDWGKIISDAHKDAFRVSPRDLAIYEAFDGLNHVALARQYGMTVRGIYKVIKQVQAANSGEAVEVFRCRGKALEEQQRKLSTLIQVLDHYRDQGILTYRLVSGEGKSRGGFLVCVSESPAPLSGQDGEPTSPPSRPARRSGFLYRLRLFVSGVASRLSGQFPAPKRD